MENKISEDEFGVLSTKLIIDYLKKGGAVEIHKIAMTWNFDNPQPILPFIVDNPDTDKATILLIYWLMQPAYYKSEYASREEMLKENPYCEEAYDLQEKMEKNYLSGFYKNQRFEYNPYLDHYGVNRIAEIEGMKLKRPIPEEMIVILSGEKIDEPRGWCEGIPVPILDEWNKLVSRIDEEM